MTHEEAIKKVCPFMPGETINSEGDKSPGLCVGERCMMFQYPTVQMARGPSVAREEGYCGMIQTIVIRE